MQQLKEDGNEQSGHVLMVKKYMGYIEMALLTIPQHKWHKYTMEHNKLISNFTADSPSPVETTTVPARPPSAFQSFSRGGSGDGGGLGYAGVGTPTIMEPETPALHHPLVMPNLTLHNLARQVRATAFNPISVAANPINMGANTNPISVGGVGQNVVSMAGVGGVTPTGLPMAGVGGGGAGANPMGTGINMSGVPPASNTQINLAAMNTVPPKANYPPYNVRNTEGEVDVVSSSIETSTNDVIAISTAILNNEYPA